MGSSGSSKQAGQRLRAAGENYWGVCVSAMDRCYRVYVGMQVLQASTREHVQVCMCMVREKTVGG